MRWVAPALFLLLSSCAFDLEPCSADEDCPPGTTCTRPTRTDAPMCIAPDEVVESANNDPADLSTKRDDEIDPIPWDADNLNNSQNNTDPLNCPVVDNCGADEPNDSEDDAIFLTRFAQGCAGFGLEEWSALYQDSVCADDVDQFVVEYVPCEQGAFKLTVSLTTPDTCLRGGELEISEGLYDCLDDNVRCEVVDDAQRITVIVNQHERPNPVEKMRFAVRPGLAENGVNYILRATISR